MNPPKISVTNNIKARFMKDALVHRLEENASVEFALCGKKAGMKIAAAIKVAVERDVLPSYDVADHTEMLRSITYETWKEGKYGRTVKVEASHPFLYMREFGMTPEGKTLILPTGGRTVMWVPYERAILSDKLAPLAERALEIEAKRAPARNHKPGVKVKNAVDLDRVGVVLRHVELVKHPFFEKATENASAIFLDEIRRSNLTEKLARGMNG